MYRVTSLSRDISNQYIVKSICFLKKIKNMCQTSYINEYTRWTYNKN